MARILSLLLLCCGLFSGSLMAQQPTNQAEARALLSALGYDSGRFSDVSATVRHFPTLGLSVQVVKGLDPTTGEVVGGALDSLGHPVDLAALRAREIAAHRASPLAKMQSSLRQLVEAGTGGDLPVVVWLTFDEEQLDALSAQLRATLDPVAPDKDAVRDVERQIQDFAMARNQEVTDSFLPALAALGLAPRYVSTTAPVVFVDADIQTLTALAALPEVDTLYLERFDRHDTNNDANATHRTDRVHAMGIKGEGINVALLENNGVDPANPYLNVVAWFNAATPNPDNHIHGTSGCVASLRSDRIGAAPDVGLYSANAASYSDANVTAAADWIVTQNVVDITNMSFGGNHNGAEQYLDRYFDYQVRTYLDSYVAAAGNDGLLTGGPVGSPGTSYNVLTVGSFADGEDGGNWTGDAMAGSSSYGNPNSGCEKPNLAANGVCVQTLGDSAHGWINNCYSGTSFASPHCAGNLADALSINWVPVVYPSAATALMMATAWHNIEGASRLSSKDGAGGLHGLAAVRAARDRHVRGVTVNASSFSATGYYTYNIQLRGGDLARVCISWLAKANSSYSTSNLDADLDLAIFAGQDVISGTAFGYSSSWNNNFEIVEFTPPSTGWYTVRVNDFAFAGTSEELGIAWSQKSQDATQSARLREFTSEAAPTAGPTIGNTSYWMDFNAPHSPSAVYFASPGSLLGDGFSFSSQNWSPLSIDIWTLIWFDDLNTGNWFWTNSFGVLTSSGSTFSHSMSLPALPSLVGTKLSHIGYLLEAGAGYPDNIKEMTDPHTFTFWPAPVDHTLTDDGNFLQALPFGFNFYGQTYTECYVNANGNITFGSASSDWTPSSADMLSGPPRIAFLWADLGPHQLPASGTEATRVREVFQGDQSLVVEFINVPLRTPGATGSTGSGANTVRVTLAADGTITMEYRDCTLSTCLVGLSPGGNVSSATSVDLTSSGEALSGWNDALYEYFNLAFLSQGLDLDHPSIYYNKLVFAPTDSSHQTYVLHMDVVH